MDGSGGRGLGGNSQPVGCRVLVADDNVDAAETLAELLRMHGHEVVTAHSGPDALTIARAFAPEVVFLDLGLRGLDGYEVARQLRAASEKSQLRRLVAVTGYGTSEDRRQSRLAGFDAHLVKPVDPSEYLSAIDSIRPPDPA